MTRYKALAAALLLAGLNGCTSFSAIPESFSIYDIGPQGNSPVPVSVPLVGIDVVAPSWLSSSAMQYRLVPQHPLERRAYTNSRWAGMPSEMVRIVVGRVIEAQPATNGSGCRLRVDVDEFIQRFDTVDTSVGLIELRASLLAPRTDAVMATKAFAVEVPTPTADAAGGVIAMRAGVNQLAIDAGRWLAALEPATSGADSFRTRCSR
ncbi:MAG TPA: ABC-type transport auxiliary lipoprotein family protein [Denitromonas sp.]|nr:membrane integrity-associated transporter subunit PqiC [Rhodocyclaceae bacterium]MCP5220112.1 membrane integrity-associated transporter subunit PqiC [Zoogloeaceae bacterium]HPR08306.1 ABC-type transport auxiliary lipoprotein family protein [Denitromonas sp.]HQV13383.1 ABC-type transport auxiliary lipoprotein family protein [Denitromonas sp.]